MDELTAVYQLVEFLRSTSKTFVWKATFKAIHVLKVIVCDLVEIQGPKSSTRALQMIKKSGNEKSAFCVALRNVLFKTKLTSPGLHLFATGTVA